MRTGHRHAPEHAGAGLFAEGCDRHTRPSLRTPRQPACDGQPAFPVTPGGARGAQKCKAEGSIPKLWPPSFDGRGEESPHTPWGSEDDSRRDPGVHAATVPRAGFGGPSDHPQQRQADKPQPPTHFFGPPSGTRADEEGPPGFPGSPPDEKGSPKQTSRNIHGGASTGKSLTGPQPQRSVKHGAQGRPWRSKTRGFKLKTQGLESSYCPGKEN